MPNEYDGRVIQVVDETCIEVMLDLGFDTYALSTVEVFAVDRSAGSNGPNALRDAVKSLEPFNGSYVDVRLSVHQQLTDGLYPVEIRFYDNGPDGEVQVTLYAWLMGNGRKT